MGSRHKKALIAESVRESLHSWCKRVKERSKLSVATRSTCSLESMVDERDEITVASGTLSPRSSSASLNHQDNNEEEDSNVRPHYDCIIEASEPLPAQELSFRISEYLSHPMATNRENNNAEYIEECQNNNSSDDIEECQNNAAAADDDDDIEEGHQPETLLELFQKT